MEAASAQIEKTNFSHQLQVQIFVTSVFETCSWNIQQRVECLLYTELKTGQLFLVGVFVW